MGKALALDVVVVENPIAPLLDAGDPIVVGVDVLLSRPEPVAAVAGAGGADMVKN